MKLDNDLELFSKYFDVLEKRVNGFIVVKDKSTGKIYKRFKTITKYCEWEDLAIRTLRVHYS